MPQDTMITTVIEQVNQALGITPAAATAFESFDSAESITADYVISIIDHTALKPATTAAQIEQLCAEARQYKFASVCVNPIFVPLAARALSGSGVPVCTVVGFPLGATFSAIKAAEATQAINSGATEIDMVIHVGALKAGQFQRVFDDIEAVTEASHARGALVKVIIETVLLTDEEKVAAAHLTRLARADFVKTSTGFAGGGATVPDVALLRRVVGGDCGVKASGGIRTFSDAKGMVAAGATRLGASAGVAIAEANVA